MKLEQWLAWNGEGKKFTKVKELSGMRKIYLDRNIVCIHVCMSPNSLNSLCKACAFYYVYIAA